MSNTFYTHVGRYGSNLLYRGFKNGERYETRIKYEPTLYIPDPNGSYVSIDGQRVSPKLFESMKAVKEYNQLWSDVDGVRKALYGQINFCFQYIQEKFPDNIEFNPNLVNVTNIDIEVQSDDGFPEPGPANYPVTAICLKHIHDKKNYELDPEDELMLSLAICFNNQQTLVETVMEDFEKFTASVESEIAKKRGEMQ